MIEKLIAREGSFRLLIEAYWFGKLTHSEERTLEDHTPKPILMGFRPIIVPEEVR